MKKLPLVILVIIVVGVGIQFIPIEKTNPPVTNEIQAPAAVMAILKRVCYNCHSNETVWPWYSNYAPVSWLIASDVSEGREHINFSDWQSLPPEKKAKNKKEIWKEVREGDMPPWIYTLEHSDAHLSDEDKSILKSWAEGTMENQ